MSTTPTSTHPHAPAAAERLPWICPSCGHFIVTDKTAPHHDCDVANHTESLVPYIDSAHADDIRRRIDQRGRSGA